MKASLKSLFSMSVQDTLDTWVPSEKEFGIELTLFIGSDSDNKSDAFDVILCTPTWLARRPLPSSFMHGKYHLFVENYNYKALIAHIDECCQACSGESWQEVAMQINEWASWEFAYTIKARHNS